MINQIIKSCIKKAHWTLRSPRPGSPWTRRRMLSPSCLSRGREVSRVRSGVSGGQAFPWWGASSGNPSPHFPQVYRPPHIGFHWDQRVSLGTGAWCWGPPWHPVPTSGRGPAQAPTPNDCPQTQRAHRLCTRSPARPGGRSPRVTRPKLKVLDPGAPAIPGKPGQWPPRGSPSPRSGLLGSGAAFPRTPQHPGLRDSGVAAFAPSTPVCPVSPQPLPLAPEQWGCLCP